MIQLTRHCGHVLPGNTTVVPVTSLHDSNQAMYVTQSVPESTSRLDQSCDRGSVGQDSFCSFLKRIHLL
jgi:hypothetical protein